jgi:serine/threonine protein phosphatase PrpC
MNTDKSDEDTQELPVVPVPPEALWPETGSSRIVVELAAVSDRGLVRENNQDHYLVVRFRRSMERLLTNLLADQMPTLADEVGYGFVVADGMGGPTGGEVASQMAITTLVSVALHDPDWVFGISPEDTRRRVQRMAKRWERVQEAIHARGDQEPALGRMGTTMSAAVSLGTRLVIGHVGDSRVYVFRGGQLCQLTRDHTLVQTMVDLGELTPEEAATHPRRGMLMRSFSAAGDACLGDFQQKTLADGDQLLLCTDGLTDMVDNKTISSVLSRAASPDEACQVLLAAALKKGGEDNVTIALARYRIPQ